MNQDGSEQSFRLPSHTQPSSSSHFYELKRPTNRQTIFDDLDEDDLDRLYNHSKNQQNIPYIFGPPNYEPRFTKDRSTCKKVCRKYTNNHFFSRFNPSIRLFLVAFGAIVLVLKLRLNFDNIFSLITTFFSVFQPNIGRTLQSCWYNAIANTVCGLVLAFLRFYFDFNKLAIGILFPLTTFIICILWGAGVNSSQYKSFIGFQGTYFLIIYKNQSEDYLYVLKLFAISSIGYLVAILVALVPYPLTASTHLAQISQKTLSKLSKTLYLITKAFLTNRHSGVLSKNHHSQAFSDLVISLRSKRNYAPNRSNHHHHHDHDQSHHLSKLRKSPAQTNHQSNPINRDDSSVINEPHHMNTSSVFSSSSSQLQKNSKLVSPSTPKQQARSNIISVKSIAGAKIPKPISPQPKQLFSPKSSSKTATLSPATPHMTSLLSPDQPIAPISVPLYTGNIVEPSQDQIKRLSQKHRIERLNPIDPQTNKQSLPHGKSKGNYFLQRQDTFTEKQLQIQRRDGIGEIYNESDSDMDESFDNKRKTYQDNRKTTQGTLNRNFKKNLRHTNYSTRKMVHPDANRSSATLNRTTLNSTINNDKDNNNVNEIDDINSLQNLTEDAGSQVSDSLTYADSARGSYGSQCTEDDILFDDDDDAHGLTTTTDEDEDAEGTDEPIEMFSSSDESDGMTTIHTNKIEVLMSNKKPHKNKKKQHLNLLESNLPSSNGSHYSHHKQHQHNQYNNNIPQSQFEQQPLLSSRQHAHPAQSTHPTHPTHPTQSAYQSELNDIELQDSIATYTPFPQMYITECNLLIDELQQSIVLGQSLIPDLIVESQLFRIIYTIFCCCFRRKHYQEQEYRKKHHLRSVPDPLYPSLGQHKEVIGAPYNPISVAAFFADASSALSNAKSMVACLTTMTSLSQGGIMLYSLHAHYLAGDMKRITKLFKTFIFCAQERNPDLIPLDSAFIKCLGKMKKSGGGLDLFSALFSVLTKAHGVNQQKKPSSSSFGSISSLDGFVDVIDTQIPPEHVEKFTTSSLLSRQKQREKREQREQRERNSINSNMNSMNRNTTLHSAFHTMGSTHGFQAQFCPIQDTTHGSSSKSNKPSQLHQTPPMPSFQQMNSTLLKMYDNPVQSLDSDPISQKIDEEDDHVKFFKSSSKTTSTRIDIRAMNKKFDEMQQKQQQEQENQHQEQQEQYQTQHNTIDQLYKRYQAYKKYGKVDEHKVRQLSFVPGTYANLSHSLRNFWVLYSKLRLKCFVGVRQVHPYKYTTSQPVDNGMKITTHSGLYTEHIPPFFVYSNQNNGISRNHNGTHSPLQSLESQYISELNSPPLPTDIAYVQPQVNFPDELHGGTNCDHQNSLNRSFNASSFKIPPPSQSRRGPGPFPPPPQPPSTYLPPNSPHFQSQPHPSGLIPQSFTRVNNDQVNNDHQTFGHTLGNDFNFDNLFTQPPQISTTIPSFQQTRQSTEYKGSYPYTQPVHPAHKNPSDPTARFFFSSAVPQPPQPPQHAFQQNAHQQTQFSQTSPAVSQNYVPHLPAHIQQHTNQIYRQYQITLTDMMTLSTFFFNFDRFITRISHRLVPHLCPHLFPLMSLLSTLPPSHTLADDGREVVPPIFKHHKHSTFVSGSNSNTLNSTSFKKQAQFPSQSPTQPTQATRPLSSVVPPSIGPNLASSQPMPNKITKDSQPPQSLSNLFAPPDVLYTSAHKALANSQSPLTSLFQPTSKPPSSYSHQSVPVSTLSADIHNNQLNNISQAPSSNSFTTNLILSNPHFPNASAVPLSSPKNSTQNGTTALSTHSLPLDLNFSQEELDKLLAPPTLAGIDLYGSPRHIDQQSPPKSAYSAYFVPSPPPTQEQLSPAQLQHSASVNLESMFIGTHTPLPHSSTFEALPVPLSNQTLSPQNALNQPQSTSHEFLSILQPPLFARSSTLSQPVNHLQTYSTSSQLHSVNSNDSAAQSRNTKNPHSQNPLPPPPTLPSHSKPAQSTSLALPSLYMDPLPDFVPSHQPKHSSSRPSDAFSNSFRTQQQFQPLQSTPPNETEYQCQRSVYLSYTANNVSPHPTFAPISSQQNLQLDDFKPQQKQSQPIISFPDVRMYVISQPPVFFSTPPFIPLSTLYFILLPRLITGIITAIETVFFPPEPPQPADKSYNDPVSTTSFVYHNQPSLSSPPQFLSTPNEFDSQTKFDQTTYNSTFSKQSGQATLLLPHQPHPLTIPEIGDDDGDIAQPPSPQAITRNITYKYKDTGNPTKNSQNGIEIPSLIPSSSVVQRPTGLTHRPTMVFDMNDDDDDENLPPINEIENVVAIPSFWNRVKSALYTLIVPQTADFLYYRMIIKCIFCVMLAFLIILIPNPFDDLKYVHWATSVAAMLISESISTAFTGIVTRVQGTALGALYGYVISFFAHQIDSDPGVFTSGIYFTATTVALWAGCLTFYKLSPTANVSLSSVAISTATVVAVGAIDNSDSQGYAIRRIEMTLLGCLSVIITSFLLWPNTSINRFLKSLENSLKEARTVTKLHFSLFTLTSRYRWGASTFGPSIFAALKQTAASKSLGSPSPLDTHFSSPGSQQESGRTSPKNQPSPNLDECSPTNDDKSKPGASSSSFLHFHERTIYDVHQTMDGNHKGVEALFYELTDDRLIPAHPKTPLASNQASSLANGIFSTAPGIIRNEAQLQSSLQPNTLTAHCNNSLNPFGLKSPLRQEFMDAFPNVQLHKDKKKFSLMYDLAIRTKLASLRSTLVSQKTIANEFRAEYDLFGRNTRLYDVQLTIVNAQLDLCRVLYRFQECLILQNWAVSRLPSSAAIIKLNEIGQFQAQSLQNNSPAIDLTLAPSANHNIGSNQMTRSSSSWHNEFNQTLCGGNFLPTVEQQQAQIKLTLCGGNFLPTVEQQQAQIKLKEQQEQQTKKGRRRSIPNLPTPPVQPPSHFQADIENTYVGLQIFESYGNLINRLLTSLIDLVSECSLTSAIDTFLGLPVTFRRHDIQIVHHVDVNYGDDLQHLFENIFTQSDRNSVILKEKLKYYRLANKSKVENQTHGARVGHASYLSLYNFQFGPCFVSEILKNKQSTCHADSTTPQYVTNPTTPDIEQPNPFFPNSTSKLQQAEISKASNLVDQIKSTHHFIDKVYPGTSHAVRQQLTEAQLDKREETLTLKQIYATISKIIILYEETCKTRMSLALSGQVAVFPSLFLQIEHALIFILCAIPNILLSLTVALNTLRSETQD